MAENATLKAVLREERGKGAARRMRAAGRVPAVVYGHGEATRALSLDAHDLGLLFARISVENTIITLDIEGEGEARVLVREAQAHPFRPELIHVDFYQVHAGEKLTVEVPVSLVGNPVGVREGGVLDQMLHEIGISCLPSQIPESIEVDVSGLDIGDSVHVRDLPLPEGVEVEIDADRSVCSVTAPTVQALEETATETEGVGGEMQPDLIRPMGSEEE